MSGIAREVVAASGCRGSRILRDVPGGMAVWDATFVTDDSSQTREFPTAFEADAWLDAKVIGHMTGDVNTEAIEKAALIADMAEASGLVLEEWQIGVLRKMFAAGPDGVSMLVTTDRRHGAPDTGAHGERRVGA
jgi:hypothetical protein